MARRLALVQRPTPDAGADALRALAGALAPYLREVLADADREGELVEVATVVPLPRRAVLRACREGRVEGARRVGRRWLATRAAVNAWVRASGPRAVVAQAEDADDDLEPLRQSLARPSRPRSRRTT